MITDIESNGHLSVTADSEIMWDKQAEEINNNWSAEKWTNYRNKTSLNRHKKQTTNKNRAY
jgi:hypothetical protein